MTRYVMFGKQENREVKSRTLEPDQALDMNT